ncbi:MAG TPA: hypothetical protein VLE89_03540 [Chlamydiales bacterium]|nr:hypothetical protein [Chlamydiales bacterium]
MSCCDAVAHTFRDCATTCGPPTADFSVDVERECQSHLLSDERAAALQKRSYQSLTPGTQDTLHAYLCGENRVPFSGTPELPLLDPKNRVIHYQTGTSSLVIKGQEPSYKEKYAWIPPVCAVSRDQDHFARLKMGDWMREIQANEGLDHIEVARDYAIEVFLSPTKKNYYIGSDFIPDLLSPEEGLKALNALPDDKKRELIRQIAVMIQKSGYADVHLKNLLFKKNIEGDLIAIFIDLEPLGLFRTRGDLRQRTTQMSRHRADSEQVPDSLEEYAHLGLRRIYDMFLSSYKKNSATLKLVDEIIGKALLETQAKIDSFQTTPLSSIQPCMCLAAGCCAPCLCIKACKIWNETHPSPNKGTPPHQFMEALLPAPRL